MGEADRWGPEPLPPRVIESFSSVRNHVREGVPIRTNGESLHFEIVDDRDAHGTSAKVRGHGPEEITIIGFPILYADGKILSEIWNDNELNCWMEYDLKTKSEVFLRREELEAYMLRYLADRDITSGYLRDVERYYSTGALSYCHYYFESDKVRDRRNLYDRCRGLGSPRKRWKEVRKIFESYLKKNEKVCTWRGLCVLWLANELFFKDTSIEPRLMAEWNLLSHTALNWGGRSQDEWIRGARGYLPFVVSLFEATTAEDREREVWKVAYYQVLINLIFRRLSGHDGERADDLAWLTRRARDGKNRDSAIANVFLKGLLRTNLLKAGERALVRRGLRSPKS